MIGLKTLSALIFPTPPASLAKGNYSCGDGLSARLSVLRFDAHLTVSGHVRLRLSVSNDGRHVWPPVRLLLRWSVQDLNGTHRVLIDQSVLDLPRLKRGKERVLAAAVSVPVNSVSDVDITFHLLNAHGACWQPRDLPALLHRHVSGQSAENVPAEFDYEVMYRTVDLEKDWWTPVGPATRAEYEHLGRGKCAQLMALGLGPSSRVLDIGCGTGQLTEALVSILSPEGLYYGTDVAEPAVEFCRARFPQSQFHFVKNEQTNIPIHGVQFDFIYLGSVFTHMFPADIAVMLGEIRRLMAASGCVVADAFVSPAIADYFGNRSMIQLNESNLLAGFRKHGFKVDELSSTKWNADCRRVIYKLTAHKAH